LRERVIFGLWNYDMKQKGVEKRIFDDFDRNLIDVADLLPLFQMVFNGKSETSMEKLRYALRQGKIESTKVAKKYYPNPKSLLLWLNNESKKKLK